ncbi:MAG: hypothetical protein P8080_01175 [Gammaproteobacteria bacterium]
MSDRRDPILDRARELPRQLPPSRDLWPEIRARIEEPARPPARRTSWFPAALAASVVVAVALVALLRTSGPSAPPEAMTAGRLPPPPIPASFGPSATLGAHYQAARASLAGDLEQRLEALPPDSREVVARNLAAIHSAVAEINAALENDPGNVFLQQLLMDAYHDELAVLADLRRVTDRISNSQRNQI